MTGSVAGAFFASHVHSDVLSMVFAVMAFLMAIKLLLPMDDRRLADAVPGGPLMPMVPTFIGGVSSLLGIGGGTFSVAILTMFNHPIHRAVGTAALFGLVISLPGTIGFMVSGFGDPRLPPYSIGFVNLVGLALIAPATWLTAPLGAALAHRLTHRQLSLSFGIFLLLVSVRMLGRTL
jgi:uncharacterized membrane protein YfcA